MNHSKYFQGWTKKYGEGGEKLHSCKINSHYKTVSWESEWRESENQHSTPLAPDKELTGE